MNIFYVHFDPGIAARSLCDKHVVKMVLESAQMLCTAHRVLDGDDQPDVMYRATHKNHPCNVWLRQSVQHYNWLYQHFVALGDEYTKRYGKIHLSIRKLKDILATPPKEIPYTGFVEPPMCMPDEYKKDNDIIMAYRAYYAGDKSRFARWDKGTPAPQWYTRMTEAAWATQ